MKNKKEFKEISELGFDISEKRSEKGMTAISLAKECNVSLNALRLWESGVTRRISKDSFERLKEALS